jgi:hypothetical protein
VAILSVIPIWFKFKIPKKGTGEEGTLEPVPEGVDAPKVAQAGD